MRVVAGKYRHRIIEITNLETTRETQDRVREAIFNSIGPKIYGKSVLDLFAGSGSMGIEAISRGASWAHFNDINNKALNTVKKNLDTLGIDEYSITKLDYLEFLKNTNKFFDYIFVDPPYKDVDLKVMLEAICNSKASKNGTIISFEMSSAIKPLELENVALLKEKKYGSKKVLFFEVKK